MSTGYSYCCGQGNFLNGLGHFIVKLVGCHIECCAFWGWYVDGFHFWILWLHGQWIFTRFSFLVLVLGFVCEVSSVMNLWSNMYGPAMSDPWYVADVMIRSNVCPRLCVGMLTYCFKLKAAIVFRRVCASWSSLLFIWMLKSPMITRSWYLGSSSVSRSVNWSMKLLLLNCCSAPCHGWYIPIMV